MKKLVPGLVIGALVLGTSAVAAQSPTLQAVQDRGSLICGLNSAQPGMSVLAEDGSFQGMDADYCRGVAAAIGVDVEYVPLNADQRATAVQTGEVDVLFRNTTNKLSRDSTWGDFGPTILYDGQGIMVRADSSIETLNDLNGATICVTAGTTTEQNLADVMNAAGIEYTPNVFSETDAVYGTYEEGACDAVTGDKVGGLVGRKIVFAEPEAHIILPDTLSKEPLGPVWANGDNTWGDIIKWVVYATINAEELGITQANVTENLGSDNPAISRFLGDTGELGEPLGLDNDFAVAVISEIGNYGEIYDRHLGPDTALNVTRAGTVNDLWINGGLMYSPPFS